MAKKRAKRTTKKIKAPPLPKREPQRFSFSVDAVDYISAVLYNLRQAIESKAVEESGDNTKNIPLSVVKGAVKSLGLEH